MRKAANATNVQEVDGRLGKAGKAVHDSSGGFQSHLLSLAKLGLLGQRKAGQLWCLPRSARLSFS